MSRIKKQARQYAYRMGRKYRQDPFAFIILWALFFSAIFLIFAFRGLIAANFIKKIDIDNSFIVSDENTLDVVEENNDEPDANNDAEIQKPQVSGDTYTVQSGDTLYAVSLELDKDWQEIASLNDIEPPYSLSVGQVLQLP